jgi:hypothetical protein
MLNGLTLLLTSILVNPLLFILTGFEALIAATNLVRIKKKRDINVAKIGKVKTVVLFFTTVLSLLTPMIPSLKLTSTILIGLTAALQAMTAGKYLSEYHKENKAEKMAEEPVKEESVKPIAEEDPVKKLEYAKEKLTTLATKNTIQVPTVIADNVKPIEVFEEEIIPDDDMGIAKTFKK